MSVSNPNVEVHNLVILKGRAPDELDPNILANQYLSFPISEAETNLTFKAPGMPGEYKLVCSVGNHMDLGEQGTLVVVIPEN